MPESCKTCKNPLCEYSLGRGFTSLENCPEYIPVNRVPKLSRVKAQPSAWTFKIKPIAELLARYVDRDGIGWVDPYAGENSPAQFTNDLVPERKAVYHMDALAFCRDICPPLKPHFDFNGRPMVGFRGILFDPPYSHRQVSEHYKSVGIKATSMDTSANFYSRVKNAICDQIKIGGYAICMGWNSSGFGENRGYELVEFLDVPHGGHHYDTLVTVEQRVRIVERDTEGKVITNGNRR